MESDGLACFDGEFFLGEEKSFGDAGDLDGFETFLRIKRGLGGTSSGGLQTVRFFEIRESPGDGGSVC